MKKFLLSLALGLFSLAPTASLATDISIATRDYVKKYVKVEIDKALDIATNTPSGGGFVPYKTPQSVLDKTTVYEAPDGITRTYTSKVTVDSDTEATLEFDTTAAKHKAVALCAPTLTPQLARMTTYLWAADTLYVNQANAFMRSLTASNAIVRTAITNESGQVSIKDAKTVFLEGVSVDGERFVGSTYKMIGRLYSVTNSERSISFALTYALKTADMANSFSARSAAKSVPRESGDGWQVEEKNNNWVMTITEIVVTTRGRTTRYELPNPLVEPVDPGFPAEKDRHECDIQSSDCNCKYLNKSCNESDYPAELQNAHLKELFEEALDFYTWFPEDTLVTHTEGGVTKKGVMTYDAQGNERFVPADTMMNSDSFKAATGKLCEMLSTKAADLRYSFRKYYTCDKASKMPNHDWQETTCGANKWKVCKRNSSHREGTEKHDDKGHSAGHKCSCGRQTAPGAGTWSKGSRQQNTTGWTRTDTCAVSGCSSTRTVNHTCSHEKCKNCTATIPEDNDAVCGDKCHTCEGAGGERHNFSGASEASCAHCSCSGCGMSPYEAYMEGDTFGDLFEESLHGWLPNGCTEHYQGDNEFSGLHCLCRCGLYDCNGGPGQMIHQFASADEPSYWEIPDDEEHWMSNYDPCSRCGAQWGKKESHDFSPEEGQQQAYKFIDNDGCAPIEKCKKCKYTREPSEENKTPHEKLSDSPIKCESISDDVCRHWYTCKNCGTDFYKDDECSHTPSDTDCYCQCTGCDHAKHDYETNTCGNRTCSRCGQRDPESGSESHYGCVIDGGSHHCNCYVSGKCGLTEGHIKGDREITREDDEYIYYVYHCQGTSWDGSPCSWTSQEYSEKKDPPKECRDEDSYDIADHTPLGDACGCCCGHFGPDAPGGLKSFHAFDSGSSCRCNCGYWHEAKTGGSECPDVCSSCHKKKANSGSTPYASAPDATNDDHKPASDKCGCECGHLTHTATDGKWHKQYPGKCRCYGSNNSGNGAWHFICTGCACHKCCAHLNGGTTRHLISTGNPVRENDRPASESDHDRSGLGICGCACGEYGGTSGKPLSNDSNLHGFSNQPSCKCYCGKKFRDDPLLHEYENGKCICKCGLMHKYVSGSDCPGVCAKCRIFKAKNGSPENATEDDHTPASGKCGCQCGKYTSSNAQTDRMHKFPVSHSCYCFCGESGENKRNRPTSDYQNHLYYEDGDCKCQCRNCHNGTASSCPLVCTCGIAMDTHLITGGDQQAPSTYHEAGSYPDACGCKCGTYHSSAGLTPTSNLHIWKSGNCGCNCSQHVKNPDSSSHSYTRAGGLSQKPCVCDCGDCHKGTPDPKCPGTCQYCLRSVGDTNGKVETAAPESSHTAKSDGCGCGCGEVTSATDNSNFHHNSADAESCKCNCGKKTLSHKYEFDSVCCNCYCGSGGKRHAFESGKCKCKCGEQLAAGGHASVDGQCKCQCGAKVMEHVEVDDNCYCQCGSQLMRHKSADTDKTKCNECFCGQSKEHNYAEGHCFCYCGTKLADGGHVAVQGQCHCQCEDTVPEHVSKSGQCQCECGATIPAHQSASTSPNQCNPCYCGQDKVHNRRPNSCYCWCGDTVIEHIQVPGCCYCRCGGHLFGHVYASTGCHCQCGQTTDHRYASHSSSSCNTCYCGGNTIHHASDHACTCWCGRTATGHLFMSSTCHCYCGEMTSHKTPEGQCRCYCGTIHNDKYRRAGCTRICDKCGMLISDPNKSPTKGDHTPKGSGCGCKCGSCSGRTYDPASYPSYHGGHGSPSCRCECGATHHNFSASACPSVCSVCGMNYAMNKSDPTIHTFEHSCNCNCRRYTEHVFDSDSCYCMCGDRFRGHKWEQTGDLVTGHHVCGSCGQDIDEHTTYFDCMRCGDSYEGYYEEGHDWGCGVDPGHDDERPPTPCIGRCGCDNCDCESCKNGTGTCSNCGNECGDSSEGGGGGGGESGGEGGLGDI